MSENSLNGEAERTPEDQTEVDQHILDTLSPEQGKAFGEFTARCEKDGLLKRPVELNDDDVCEGINDGPTLLRFLRARKYDVDGAYRQFSEVHAAKAKIGLIKAYEQSEISEFERARKIYPHWTGRCDREGRPVCVLDVATLDSNAMSAYKMSRASLSAGASVESLRPYIYYECLTRYILPLCSAAAGKPITSCQYLIDISTFGFKQAWSMKEYAQDTSKLLADTYPELIDHVFITGAPSYFARLWSFVKGWIDPVTADKVSFLAPSEVTPTLTKYIDPENIPVMFGGQIDFKDSSPLPLAPSFTKTLNWTGSLSGSLPPGPLKWTKRDNTTRDARAVGSNESTRRDDRFAEMRIPPLATNGEDAHVETEQVETKE